MYVNLVLKKEKYILGRIGLNFGGFGEQLNSFWGFKGAETKKIWDLGRSAHNFEGAREQGPPLGALMF